MVRKRRTTDDLAAICAAGRDSETIRCEAVAVDWIQAEGDNEDKPKRFAMTAYTGGMIQVGYWGNVVFDLAGLAASGDMIPSLLHHDPAQIVGHTDKIDIAAKTIKIAGVVSGAGVAADEVLGSARKGFPWKASVGVNPTKQEFVAEGSTAKANGQTFRGPCTIIRGGTLVEVSFVPIAADSKSKVQVAASAARKVFSMDKFLEWLKACGIDSEGLSDEQKASLQAAFDAQQKIEASGAAMPPASPPPVPPVQASGVTPEPSTVPDGVAAHRAAEAAETERIAKIRTVCAGGHAEVEAKAIREGWTSDHTELQIMRASRPTGPAIHGGTPAPDSRVLEAGMMLAISPSTDEPRLLKAYGQQTLERADRFRRVGFKELIHMCCALDGRQLPGWGASAGELIKAGFSTVSLPGILSNVGHKVMLAAYQSVPTTVDVLCRRLTASDFKTHTGYRVTGDLTLKQVGPDGELKHGTLDETGYPYSVDTFGRMFGLTRKMQINDDMGAFAEIPRLIGRGAALTKERLLWLLVHANTGNFFHSSHGNLITKALGSEGLRLATKALEEQTDDQKDPILILGRYLVVSPGLGVTADELYQSTNVNTGGSSTSDKVPNKNIWAAKYEPKRSPYISNTNFHASASATQWYLFGDPADVAAFGFASLNGVDQPIIEDVPLSGEFLGQAWRGYIDVGVCQIDPAGAVKSTGTVA